MKRIESENSGRNLALENYFPTDFWDCTEINWPGGMTVLRKGTQTESSGSFMSSFGTQINGFILFPRSFSKLYLTPPHSSPHIYPLCSIYKFLT